MLLPDTFSDRRVLLRKALAYLASVAPTEEGQPGKLARLASPQELEVVYLTAVTDLLQFLGAIEPSTDGALQITSVQAGFLIRLLIELLGTDAPLVADWNLKGVTANTSHVFHIGVDLLHALEQRRLEIVPEGQPLRVINAAIGLIARLNPDGRQAFLLAWDAAARSWQFLGGRFEIEDGSLRATMIRELAEELGCTPLVEGVDVSLMELGPLFEEQRISPTFGLLTRTSFQAYAVRFISPLPALPPDVRWIDEVELMSGVTRDAQPIAAAPYWRVRDRASQWFDSFATD